MASSITRYLISLVGFSPSGVFLWAVLRAEIHCFFHDTHYFTSEYSAMNTDLVFGFLVNG